MKIVHESASSLLLWNMQKHSIKRKREVNLKCIVAENHLFKRLSCTSNISIAMNVRCLLSICHENQIHSL